MLAVLFAWVLAATIGVAAQPAFAASPEVAAGPKERPALVAPDLVSAQISARAQGARVEVEAMRTETSSTWVNPDGSLTTQQHTGQIRFRQGDGSWRDVDLALVETADGTAAAKGHPLGLSLAGSKTGAGQGAKGSDGTDLVKVDEKPGKDKSARQVVLGWPGALPAPRLSGEQATYRDALPGVDVVVESRRSGFEQLTVVKDRASLAALTGDDGTVSVSFPVKTKGLTGRVEEDGSVSFVDSKDVVVSRFVAPLAWDAVVDQRMGDPANVTPVKVALTQQGKGKATLTLSLDKAWVGDEARVFPVTIDPTYASGANVATSFDTYVQKDKTWDTSAETELRVGTSDGGSSVVARSFLNFTNYFTDKQIMSASLSINETYSYSCTAKTVTAYTSGVASTATRWTDQPTLNTANSGGLSVAKGYSSSCPGGRVAIPITNIVKAWSGVSTSSVALRLSASETDNLGWKKFASRESSTDPYVTYTYNRKPNLASAPTLGTTSDGANTYVRPSTQAVQIFTKDSTPRFYTTATDPDANKVSYSFQVHDDTSGNTLVSSCTTGFVASGTKYYCSPSTALANDEVYYVRVAVKDENGLWNGSYSSWTTFITQRSTPPTPQISCNQGYSDGTWTDALPAGNVTCSITAAGVSGTYVAPGYLDLVVDGKTESRFPIEATNSWSTVHKTVSFAPSNKGYHSIEVTALSRSLIPSAKATTGFGWGSATLTTPVAGAASSGSVKVTAGAPPKLSAGTTVTAKTQWRLAGSGNETTGWTDAAATAVDVTPTTVGTPTTYSGNFDLATAVREAGKSADIPSRVPVRLDVQVCFTYTGTTTSIQCTWSESPITVTRLPHAFGDGYPTADAGVGQVALFTGEVATDSTDVSVPGYSGDITLSRSHVSFAGDQTLTGWPSDPVTGVFGPGWTANLEGGESGLAGLQVLDNTGVDGSIVFLDGDGEPLVYTSPSGLRAYPTATTVFKAATQDTAESAVKLTWSGTGAGARLTLTEDDGTATVWQPKAAPALAGTTWTPLSISEPGQNSATAFGRDGTGRVTRIVAPVPEGLAGTDPCPTSGTLVKGCRAIDITYATTTTATSTTLGDVAGQVKSVSAWLWNPTTSAMSATVVATYTYDGNGRLINVRDPRTNLGTDYGWDGTTTRIAAVRQVGLAWTKLAYTSGKLTAVTRENPVSGQPDVTVARYVYGIPVSGTGLPNLSTATAWDQNKPAVSGYAVWGQDYSGPVTGTGVDYTYADLSYVDDLGYTVNTVNYGAGAWRISSTDYDSNGNIVRELDPSATAAAVANPALDEADVDALSIQTFYNDPIMDGATVVVPAGSRVTDTYGPVRSVVLADGTEVPARPHTHTDYDQGAPLDGQNKPINAATGQYYSLPTTITTGAASPAAVPGEPDIETISTTTTGYAKLLSTDATEGNGWTLGQATTTTTGGITRKTRYDTLGRVTETRQPLSNGSDAGTTKTAYYTVAAQSGANAGCGNRPEWAGLTCRTYPAAAPSTGLTLPDETTTYSMWLLPATVTEVSGAATRITTTTYDSAERAVSTKTTLTGVTGSTSRPGTFTKYRTSDGLVDYTGVLNTAGTDANTTGRTTTTYDRWGRATTVVGDAGTVTTAYDAAGRVQSVTDAKGTTTYTYDGTGEKRGLVTSMTVTRYGGNTLTYKAAYDADGNLTSQTLPGRVTQVTEYDEGGEPVALSYLGQVTPVTDGGTDPDTGETIWVPGTPIQDQPWITWTVGNDATGRVRLEATGTGAAFDDGDGVVALNEVVPYADSNGQASSYARDYRYDTAGRLTYVADAASSLDPATGNPVATCTERGYTFDGNGRRTQLVTTSHPDGDCASTGTAVTTATTGWDTADRPTTGRGGVGTYVYDLLGRQTTVPKEDAPLSSVADITLGYYDDDLPRSVTQGGTSTTFTLDADGRRSVQTTVTGSTTTTTTRRYTDGSDNPAWADVTTGSATSTTRFTESIAGDLAATIDDTTGATTRGEATMSLANLHGDVVTNVTIPPTQTSTTPATTISGWASYDEYGNTTTADPVDGPLGYGWLGAKQRSATTATAGLTLMGVRLYNPARGHFTVLDPVSGGNDTAYSYPSDPIGQYDLDGLRRDYRYGGVRSAGYNSAAATRQSNGWIKRYRARQGTIAKPYRGSATARRYSRARYMVYGIYNRQSGATYKYGITRVGTSRPKSQLSKCGRYYGSGCTYRSLRIRTGYYQARRTEASYITRYYFRYGKCPPGHGYPCR